MPTETMVCLLMLLEWRDASRFIATGYRYGSWTLATSCDDRLDDHLTRESIRLLYERAQNMQSAFSFLTRDRLQSNFWLDLLGANKCDDQKSTRTGSKYSCRNEATSSPEGQVRVEQTSPTIMLMGHRLMTRLDSNVCRRFS